VASSYSLDTNCLEWRTSSHSAYNGSCVAWRISSHSHANNNCVQVAPSVLVRDSKLGDASVVLSFTPDVWKTFTLSLKGTAA
jgi:hypothetical protein